MLDNGTVRDRLVDIIRPAVPDTVAVHRSAFDGPVVTPMIIIGMPDWADTSGQSGYCFPRSTWPIAVCVARPGTADEYTVDGLDDLWPLVLEAVRDAAEVDQTLGGVVSQAVVDRATFGGFAVQGTDYPAQMILIDLYG